MRMATVATLVDLVRDRATTTPYLIGVAGAVAVGKTTIVRALAQGLQAPDRRVQVVSTDSFLLANAVLAERGLLMRKGFPESYDTDAMRAALQRLRAGQAANVRVYSHDVYDVVPDASETIAPTEMILVEGIVALQAPAGEYLDLALYIDADEAIVRAWFVERFLRLTAAAADQPVSFYHPFAQLPVEQVQQIAVATWDTINAPNLREHIAPSAARADVVVRKAADHSIAELRAR
jgi:type I pantothenate kinase